MLVNLSPRNDFRTIQERLVNCAKKYNRGYKIKYLKFSEMFEPTEYVGVYYGSSMNFIRDYCKQHLWYNSKTYREIVMDFSYNRCNVNEYLFHANNAWTYGVADNLEQIVKFYNEGNFKGNHVILCHTVKKNPNEPHSGWRWHKHGEYIGNRNPQREYFNDEPEIDEVIVFSIYKVV